ncbi:DinB family protein [Salinithrix halophila]|uniref:DinB family protein n=1 Tax=Salinithrix halophila TaxID=1485204 RepID=A0ABV8JEB8_9BACL
MKAKEEILQDWKRSRAYTESILDAMPEEKGDYKPAGDVMSFRQQLLHILYAEEWFLRGMIEGNWEKSSAFAPENHPDLAAVKDAFRTTTPLHESWISQIEDLEAKVKTPISEQLITRKALLMKLILHEAHHRGQLVIYLRMNGLTPPSFRI